jgi:hypothetical protein
MLIGIDNTPGQEGVDYLLEGEYSIIPGYMTSSHHFWFPEAKIRHNVTDMKFQLLFPAAAAKYHFTETGKFPSTDNDFKKYLTSGIPEDAFNSGSPLKFRKLKNNNFAVYSFGPDRKDNKASLKYDPTKWNNH